LAKQPEIGPNFGRLETYFRCPYLVINTRQEIIFLVRQLEQLRLLPLRVDHVDGVVAVVGVGEQRQEQTVESLTTANQTQKICARVQM